MSASSATLAAFEIAVRSGGAAFARSQLVGVHREAHAATGFAPLETGFIKNFVEPFGDGLAGDFLRAGHGERAHTGGNFFAFHKFCRLTQIGHPAVSAGANEDNIHRRADDGLAFLKTHVLVGLAHDELVGLGK